jgi:hypothetical protein
MTHTHDDFKCLSLRDYVDTKSLLAYEQNRQVCFDWHPPMVIPTCRPVMPSNGGGVGHDGDRGGEVTYPSSSSSSEELESVGVSPLSFTTRSAALRALILSFHARNDSLQVQFASRFTASSCKLTPHSTCDRINSKMRGPSSRIQIGSFSMMRECSKHTSKAYKIKISLKIKLLHLV